MTDIEHAKMYAKESIRRAISMYNPKAEIIAETACLYGLTYKNKRIADLEQKLEQAEKDLADYQFNYPTIKELQKENADLKAKNKWYSEQVCNKECAEVWGNLDKAKDLLAKWVELYNPKLEGFPKTPIQIDTEQFLKEIDK